MGKEIVHIIRNGNMDGTTVRSDTSIEERGDINV